MSIFSVFILNLVVLFLLTNMTNEPQNSHCHFLHFEASIEKTTTNSCIPVEYKTAVFLLKVTVKIYILKQYSVNHPVEILKLSN